MPSSSPWSLGQENPLAGPCFFQLHGKDLLTRQQRWERRQADVRTTTIELKTNWAAFVFKTPSSRDVHSGNYKHPDRMQHRRSSFFTGLVVAIFLDTTPQHKADWDTGKTAISATMGSQLPNSPFPGKLATLFQPPSLAKMVTAALPHTLTWCRCHATNATTIARSIFRATPSPNTAHR